MDRLFTLVIRSLPHRDRPTRAPSAGEGARPTRESLIRGRFLDVIDDENIHRALGRREFQPELFL